MSERIWIVDKESNPPDDKDVTVFEHAGVTYAFRINTSIVDNMDALNWEYSALRARPTAAEVDIEIKKLEKQTQQCKQRKRKTGVNSELELKISRLREICTTLAGILAERKGVEVGRIYQLFNISSS